MDAYKNATDTGKINIVKIREYWPTKHLPPQKNDYNFVVKWSNEGIIYSGLIPIFCFQLWDF